jgi:hypothetical protein
MSEFAFFSFLSSNLLSAEEREHKAEIVDLTEEVLHAHGLECDSKISKLSEDTVKDILAEVRNCDGLYLSIIRKPGIALYYNCSLITC